MSKKLKLFLGISYLFILIAFLYFIFLKVEISRLNDFSYYKELQEGIDVFIGQNLYLNLLKFFTFSVIWVVLLGFGLPILMIAGILFGKCAVCTEKKKKLSLSTNHLLNSIISNRGIFSKAYIRSTFPFVIASRTAFVQPN